MFLLPSTEIKIRPNRHAAQGEWGILAIWRGTKPPVIESWLRVGSINSCRTFPVVSQRGHVMKTLRFAFLVVFVVAAALVTSAHADGPRGCPPWRPCGPGNSFGGNRLIGQGFYGADFRPACAAHDACLGSGGSRWNCDQQFLDNMNCACENSNHPVLCRMKAYKYFLATRVLGGLYY